MDLDVLLQATKKQLKPERFEHTLRVVDTAVELAKRFGADPSKARIASILHDYCKFWSREQLTQWIKRYQLPLDLLQYHKEIWHAPVGAEVAREVFGIVDEDILQAIRSHTVGRPDMSILDKVVYLADYIEPGRKFPGVDGVRRLAEIDLDVAVLQAMDNTILFLQSQKQPVYPLAIAARDELKRMLSGKRLREESV
ncbi:bis(5'-nucleosyl)-tetraphosphatase (symmetrical) YqeK [Thermoactinomyces sp. DSM 45892]|uniref:bis(5'-nucleosyl)-tetraphosphatase (symmetrical) YqeK n=1 Tax=Thermoactinomyces sp. DSM 45892 TaxID=1882753 RepID=UPI00089839E7|nr:bis(5'-nucleosyl)-tetraphosphatase (symmetrical) YqeK [Thermoactinomyces sp. DSM 45892]SDZ24419.1 putative HD superfamily hydrolase of NAD metabolism [Thermoactinomyces sp. DSM 45892]